MTWPAASRQLPDTLRHGIRRLRQSARGNAVIWALTGSAASALQGIPVMPTDIDDQTDEAGAHEIERRLGIGMADPVGFCQGPGIRSHAGRPTIDGVTGELMEALRKCLTGGTSEPPADVAEHRPFVPMADISVPVFDLCHAERACRRLRRSKRADLLRSIVQTDQGASG